MVVEFIGDAGGKAGQAEASGRVAIGDVISSVGGTQTLALEVRADSENTPSFNADGKRVPSFKALCSSIRFSSVESVPCANPVHMTAPGTLRK